MEFNLGLLRFSPKIIAGKKHLNVGSNKLVAKLIRVYTDKTVNENQTFKTIKKFEYTTMGRIAHPAG
jgi:hypothetical protein